MALEFNYHYELLGPIWVATGASDSDSIEYIFPRLFAESLDTMKIPDHAKDYYIAKLLESYFGENLSTPILEELYADWRYKHPKSRYGETLSAIYDEMSSLATGVLAPNITGIDRFGEVFSLDELKGNVIYIDVWATWCSPCRKKLPDMYSLMEELKDFPDLKFLFISVDEDLDKWQTHLSTLPEGGIHLNAESKRLRQDYMIQGIPHYIIIDASGIIYQSNAPDPDTEEIKGILKEIAYKAS
jgi:thiol-disulfide isomerase/thioredoxin